MSEFDVQVEGTKPPRKPEGPLRELFRRLRNLARALLLRPRAVALAGLVLFILIVGTPHAGWDYECRNPRRSGQPCRSIVYCAYYGIQGRRVEFPEYGEQCSVVKFLRIDWGRLFGTK